MDLGSESPPFTRKKALRYIRIALHVATAASLTTVALGLGGAVYVVAGILVSALVLLRAFRGPGSGEGVDEWPPARAWNAPSGGEVKAWSEPGYERKLIRCPRAGGKHATIFTQKFAPLGGKKDAKAVVVYSHGLNSYAGQVMKDLLFMRDRGYAVVAADMEGHGRSSGAHGHFTSIDFMAEDTVKVASWARELYPGKKLILMGGSMGGLVAIEASMRLSPPADGMLLMCPLIKPHGASEPSALVQRVGRMLQRWAPRLRLAAAHKGNNHNPVLEEPNEALFQADPLNYREDLQVASGFALKDAFDALQKKMHRVRTPFLVQHGTNDKAVDIKGSEMLVKEASSKQKELVRFKGGHHTLSLEVEPMATLVMDGWIEYLESVTG